MKHFSLILGFILLVFVSSSCKENKNEQRNDGEVTTEDVNNPLTAEGNADMSELPQFQFDVKEYDFGTIIQGEKVSYTFTFKNTGKSELIINNVKTSCGCTSPKWSKEPIGPGKSGQIEVIFDSHGRNGEQNKTIKVFANTQPKTEELRITCNIAS